MPKQNESEKPVTTRSAPDQARALKERARTGGLKFEAYLPPGLAEWVLEMVAAGMFEDPSEAVFVFMSQAQDLEPHDDLKSEILKRSVDTTKGQPELCPKVGDGAIRRRVRFS